MLVADWGTLVTVLVSLYGLAAAAFIVSENRAPQATLAWMLAFIFAPGLGVLVYFLFGRDNKAFSKRAKLLKQDLGASALPLIGPLLARQDALLAAIERDLAGYRRLLTLVRRNSHSVLTSGNRVEIQQDAAQFYPNLVKDIQAARQSVHLQYFTWAADSFTDELKAVLAAKSAEGVEVRLLYDPIGSQAHIGPRYVKDVRAAGIRIAPTSPLYHLHTISYRNHRKITVVDGTIAYVGGMNIGKEHLDGGKGFDAWRDTQIRVVGEGAAVLHAVFMVDWYNATGENLFSEAYYPQQDRELGDDEVAHGVPVQILTSGPDAQWAAIRQLYATMIVAAKKHVFIQSPFFLPDATLAEALRSAALGGIDVRIMVSARASGNRLPEWAGNTFMADIVASGVKVFLYERGYLHAKTISIDSRICSVGSTNIDIRSFSINYEVNAVLYCDRLATQLEAQFIRDLADCTEFDPAAYRQRHVIPRFRDSVARLFSPLL